jgi:hypothetical protein
LVSSIGARRLYLRSKARLWNAGSKLQKWSL